MESVTPETIPNIYHARCLSKRRWEERLFAYPNIGALLTERATATPDKNWLTFYDENGRAAAYTYAEFYEAARRVAGLMAGPLSLRTGDRIATLMVNDPRTVLIYFGAWLLGLTVVPINCGEDDERIGYILQNSQAKAVFALGEQTERVEACRDSLPALRACFQVGGPIREGWNDFDADLALQTPLETPPEISPDTECQIVYTSGTTGAPKGVVLEQANLLTDADSIAEWYGFGPNDRAMCVLPIHHVNGTNVTLMVPLYTGGSVVLNRRFRAQTFWQTLAEEGCTWVSVVPTVLAFLTERHDDLSQFDLSRFQYIICGAGPLTVEVARRFYETFGIRIVHGYGLSETTCYSCFLPVDLDDAAYRHWMFECGFPSIGCPIPCNEMAIHDTEGHPLPEDTRG
ncbi:MAG TPA: long-chain fatty acid--CoA ligase, partial [Chthonomonadaceae bacterium]|nr:long-chain fatty acid--CoA ligase [Chthonomonadaceae bacterium]